jgi:NAD(P)-dependent dehydrogenase (short-subunit alcohol dehydrogenase family)
MGRLAGKVALVTGGSAGIGRAAALACAAEGARVVVANRTVDGGTETVRLIKRAGGEAAFVQTDVVLATDVEALIAATLGLYGRLDYACNNAGTKGKMAVTTECTEAEWDQVMAVNLTGVWRCMKYELWPMLEQGSGVIVNVSSAFGLVGGAGLAAYTASKHGVVGLTRAAALEYARAGIRINAVCPGAIRTPRRSRLPGNDAEAAAPVAVRSPIGRAGTPAEVAAAVVWLCSEAASFVTGHIVTVDGGLVVQ